MKLRVVACGVLEPELTKIASETRNEIHLHFLDAGLHATPELLREQAQQQIDAAVGRGYGAVVLGYGLCGRGTSGLIARDTRVVIPRVHDCMTLFLGSREEYRRQFARHPGTYYTTPGWYEKKSSGGGPRTSGENDAEIDPRFRELSDKFGEANADHIIHFLDSWKRTYTRSCFIDTGYGDTTKYERYAQAMAQEYGWEYERLTGDVSLLRELLAGRWDLSRVLVLEPGQRSALTGDDRIFEAITIRSDAQGASTATVSRAPEPAASADADPGPLGPDKPAETARDNGSCDGPESAHGPQPLTADQRVGLGIDAGGTYTDCVIYDLAAETVLAKSKALTTPHDLMVGINNALDLLRLAQPERIELVALSTTLATNAIVEAKGGQPGAIIMCSAIGGRAPVDWTPASFVRGEMTIGGTELVPVDPAEVRAVVDEMLQAGVDAFAVSGYAGVKNPSHELAIKQIIASRCKLPVICGHELSSRLNFVNRANTAILNARLLPLVRELLDAVENSLVGRGVRATTMVVKGDGSLVNRRTALERPIETILSGPAASVSGAKHLTGLRDAIILDMGGTTTDTAIIEDGLVRVDPEGARVGGWRTSVEAADISTVGLGGDSHLDFTADRKLLVGPRRVIPLAYLCHEYPSARDMLAAIDVDTTYERSRAFALDFFLLGRSADAVRLNDGEQAVVAALADGPLSRSALARRAGLQSGLLLQPRRLEGLGVVQRCALTPTDILHVTGQFRAWDAEAARLGLEVFAGLMGTSPEKAVEMVRQAVVERLAGQIIDKEMPGSCGEDPDTWSRLLRTVFDGPGAGKLSAAVTYDRAIVAIGAPVEPFFPKVGEYLGGPVVIPPHAEVANAIGAIASEVVVRESATIRPGEIANYVVHTRSGRSEYDDLTQAIESAKTETAALARERASYAGTASRQVRHTVDERRAFSSHGEDVLVEVLVQTTVTGKPELRAAT